MLTTEEWTILRLSLIVALCSTAVLTPFGVALAWLLARRRFPGKIVIDALVHAPLVLPPVVTGYAMLLLLGRRGPIGGWLESTFGIVLAFDQKGAVVAAAVMSLPLLVRAVRLSFEAGDRKIEDAAATCGAGRWRVFWTIVIPAAAPGIIAGMVLAFARALGEFGATMTFAGNIPGETRTIAVAIFTYLQMPDGDPPALRLAVISAIVSVLALIGSEWLSRRFTSVAEKN